MSSMKEDQHERYLLASMIALQVIPIVYIIEKVDRVAAMASTMKVFSCQNLLRGQAHGREVEWFFTCYKGSYWKLSLNI
jgi:hypothetical protein